LFKHSNEEESKTMETKEENQASRPKFTFRTLRRSNRRLNSSRTVPRLSIGPVDRTSEEDLTGHFVPKRSSSQP